MSDAANDPQPNPLISALRKARNFVADLQHEADPEARDLLAELDGVLAGERTA